MGRYRTIVADPPWNYSDKLSSGGNSGFGNTHHSRGGIRGAANHYKTMDTERIKRMQVARLAAEEAHLYLWVTNAFMEEGLEVMRSWGFKQKTILTWVKPQIGMGRYYRNNTEHILFGVKGKLTVLRHNQPTSFEAPRRQHSEKPQEFYDIVESMSPGPYLELFARKPRDGWAVWGDEIRKERKKR